MSDYYDNPGLWSSEELDASYVVVGNHRKIISRFIDYIYELMNSESSSKHNICQVVREMKVESDDEKWGPFFAFILVNRRAHELILWLKVKKIVMTI